MNFLGLIGYKTIYWIMFLIVYKQGSCMKTIIQIAFCYLSCTNNLCLKVFGSKLHVCHTNMINGLKKHY